jgi:ATP-dependent DNA helicase DinG
MERVPTPATDVLLRLDAVTDQLAGAESRPGQRDMAVAVADAIAAERHLVVQAGTGTGKSLGYLVPAIASGSRVVVATATKALQDQLASQDLPFLELHLGIPFQWAVLKGRSNYLCLQKVREVTGATAEQLALDDLAPTTQADARRLAAWAGNTATGDVAELDWAPSERAWAAVSATSDECPGAARCPMGEPCFAEAAKRRAQAADVVVVNTHLYGLNVASDDLLLPEHDVVVIDEAHQLEDVASDTNGIGLGAGRFTNLARVVRGVLADPELLGRITDAGRHLTDVLASYTNELLADPLPVEVADALTSARLLTERVGTALRGIETTVDDARQRVLRAQKANGTLADDLDIALAVPPGSVAWVTANQPLRLAVAPLDVGPTLYEGVWSRRTAILTSATIPLSLIERVGLPPEQTDAVDVGSSFDFETNGLLYCATHLADPRSPAHQVGVRDELRALIEAAGGRTLALFTSWKAMREAAEALRPVLPYRILTQDELPKPALVDAFRRDESCCLFATAGFFQGIDVPGRTLSLVSIDRIPFPRPDEPLLRARRQRLGSAAFRVIDLPRAATLLAQATGRLIRSTNDRGVVAILDPRLATATYRWDIVRALPPMRRTRERDEVEAFLRDITGHGA